METEKIQHILSFEAKMEKVHHKYCDSCRSVSIAMSVHTNKRTGKTYCDNCKKNVLFWSRKTFPDWLPTWKDDDGKTHFNLPDELIGLREGEKLLIQRLSLYVPMEHLKYGAHGCNGHCCCFPQSIQDVCNELPRISVEAVQVVKNYNSVDGTTGSLKFCI